jgi:AcrR family transcriptional regulator
MTTRLTRKEQQALTRSTLIGAALSVLAEKGLRGASIDDIASAAGYTKGAFYANFKSKEELYLVMLDAHFAERLAAIERLTSDQGEITEQAARVGQDFIGALRGDEAWCRLFLEFTTHATRDAEFRRELVARNQAVIDQIAEIFERRIAEAGIVPSLPPRVVAQMTFAMAHGVAIEQLLDKNTPEDMFGTILWLFFTGLLMEPPVAAPE